MRFVLWGFHPFQVSSRSCPLILEMTSVGEKIEKCAFSDDSGFFHLGKFSNFVSKAGCRVGCFFANGTSWWRALHSSLKCNVRPVLLTVGQPFTMRMQSQPHPQLLTSLVPQLWGTRCAKEWLWFNDCEKGHFFANSELLEDLSDSTRNWAELRIVVAFPWFAGF